MNIPTLLNPDGRKAWSFFALMGASLVFTTFAMWAIWHVRSDLDKTFWLGIVAHVQILLILSVFGAQFVKRTIKAGRDGVEISDHGREG